MALVDTTWYCNSVAYAAVPAFAVSTAYTAGQRVRQLATPTVGNERVFICIVAGTSAGSEPSWTLTRGAKTVSNTATFQECTGQAALNGDAINVATWAEVKAATPAVLGQIIKRSSGASYQICTTAGAMSASEPAFSDSAGVTTTDTTAVWCSLGPVGSFTAGMAPFARLSSAVATNWMATGNTIYVASNHAESQTGLISISITNQTGKDICKILCHNVAGSYPPTSSDLTTGATISGISNNNLQLFFNSVYTYGISFRVGVGVSSSSCFIRIDTGDARWSYFDNCSFWVANTSGTQMGIWVTTNTFAVVTWNNCKVKFANVNQYMGLGDGKFRWQNTGQILESGSSVPSTSLFKWGQPVSSLLQDVVLEALDLSQITSPLASVVDAQQTGSMFVQDCKLNAAMTIPTPAAPGCCVIQLARSSS
jgi:hypothetical protein